MDTEMDKNIKPDTVSVTDNGTLQSLWRNVISSDTVVIALAMWGHFRFCSYPSVNIRTVMASDRYRSEKTIITKTYNAVTFKVSLLISAFWFLFDISSMNLMVTMLSDCGGQALYDFGYSLEQQRDGGNTTAWLQELQLTNNRLATTNNNNK
jgi:hypothetical protein